MVDSESSAKLEVSFFRPFWGDYWIIDLGPDYEYAVVGHPSRDYLWILSRTPTLDEQTYAAILSRLGDYRVIYRIVPPDVVFVGKIGHRREVYEV